MLNHVVTINLGSALVFHLPYLTHISLITKKYGLLQLIIVCTFTLVCYFYSQLYFN